ncbi:MAG TPA: zinc-dependent metalloprotease, partial [Gemmatimonadaceae bacterium]|nr:zinc-dependent metalloprotease [Gemmatimonadaceae bacterium]
RFVPVYLMHRFAISSLARAVGGMEYSNAVSGDGQQATRPVAADRQRAALHQLLGTLDPKELAIPDTVLTLLGPVKRPFGELHDTFDSRTFPMFDELGAARALAQLVIDDILQRERAGRLVAFAARSADALSLDETIDSLVSYTWNRPAPADRKLAAIQRVTARALADRLIALAADTAAAPEVRAMAELEIADLRPVAASRAKRPGSTAARAHWASIAGDFTRWIERRELPTPTPALEAPPIAPFGQP